MKCRSRLVDGMHFVWLSLEFTKQPPVGIYVLTGETDITKVDVLIVGPEGTPYQGGFFHFYVSFGDDYPFQPPKVKLMTTDHGKVKSKRQHFIFLAVYCFLFSPFH